MSPITTHVLDTSLGRPGAGVAVTLQQRDASGTWQSVGAGVTNEDGRVTDLLAPGALQRGVYRLGFDTGSYFRARGVAGFYPIVEIVFEVSDASQHHHVPLLISPFGYSTYRGS